MGWASWVACWLACVSAKKGAELQQVSGTGITSNDTITVYDTITVVTPQGPLRQLYLQQLLDCLSFARLLVLFSMHVHVMAPWLITAVVWHLGICVVAMHVTCTPLCIIKCCHAWYRTMASLL